jgi:toxin ParE1/3/4
VRPLPVRWRPEAVQDLKELRDWIVSESGYLRIAADTIDRVLNAVESLGEFPEKARSRDDLGKGIRTIPFARSAIIVYRIRSDEVEITNVFHGGHTSPLPGGERTPSAVAQRAKAQRQVRAESPLLTGRLRRPSPSHASHGPLPLPARERRMKRRPFGLPQPRLADLLRGRIDKFSLDALLGIAMKVGLAVKIKLAGPAA